MTPDAPDTGQEARVTQGARDAAASVLRFGLEQQHRSQLWIDAAVDEMRGGNADGAFTVQAFAAFQARLTPPAPVDAEAVEGGQDRKFAFRDGQFVNRVSGEPIPHNEPIIIFRARDWHSEHILREYLSMAQDEHHKQAIRDRMAEFAAYRAAHPERMKEPGITHHIRLNDEASTPSEAVEIARLREAWKPGGRATYIGAGFPVGVTIVREVEGWYDVRFFDESTCIVRPSNLQPVSDGSEG